MTLAELIQRIDTIDDALAIYAARRWTTNSSTSVLPEPADGSLPEDAQGKTFLTTVAQAKRIIAARRALRPGVEVSADELAGAVIYFAIYDEAEPIPSLESVQIRLPVAV